MNAPAYNFAYLNEQTKRMIRRAILKAVADSRLSGAVREPRDADALWLGNRRRAGDRSRARHRMTR